MLPETYHKVIMMKGWLVIGACILAIVGFVALLWVIGTYL